MKIWPSIVRPLLFGLPAEPAHYFSMFALTALVAGLRLGPLIQRRLSVADARLEICRWGIRFAHPVGLAAGFDKDARWIDPLSRLGFSFAEIGTVTAQPQSGNSRPRLFRLPQDRALLNRMGFNNRGCDAAAARLARAAPRIPVGVNIGKSRTTPMEEAVGDYVASFRRLWPYASYFTVNVSSPNTPGLRELQRAESLRELLSALQGTNLELAGGDRAQCKALLVKIAPDLSPADIHAIVDTVQAGGAQGLIATNTTVDPAGLHTSPRRLQRLGAGGISGLPLQQRSRVVVREAFRRSRGALPIIGVGGVMEGEDAWRMIGAGASLVQVYTGFIYGGPTFPRDVARHLLRRLDETGLTSIEQAVGRDV